MGFGDDLDGSAAKAVGSLERIRWRLKMIERQTIDLA